MADATRSDSSDRDYGDSAGYGTGGSTSDYREVVGEDASRPGRPNPLDAVMSTPTASGRAGANWGTAKRADVGLALMAASAAVTVLLGVLVWRRIPSGGEQRRKYVDREQRERAARFQF
jgi:hypothetical protein